MALELLMGNEAIGLAAIQAGVNVVTGYPGTPSTEILETVAARNPGDVYVEWSVNEKAALEVAAGASIAGARTLVTMKMVGLNVASDPLMSLAYIGVKGGMVIVVADDPGPISSQTEQDSRQFGVFSKVPVFDPCSPEEAFAMVGEAFACSEAYETPVILRPTTRVCHASAAIDVGERERHEAEGFSRDTRWVIFPKLSRESHERIEARNPVLAEAFSRSGLNPVTGSGRKGIASGGVSWSYTQEALALLGTSDACRQLKLGTPYPFPEQAALDFLEGVDEVLVIEELSPYIEHELTRICGKHHLPVTILGKGYAGLPHAGENSVEIAAAAISAFLSIDYEPQAVTVDTALPARPPVLCAGCPHRASFYAVKRAMKGRRAVFAGDIGCYTLGNAKPLEMVDTCLCMGADVTMAQGLQRVEADVLHFAFIGDSTFFASGMTGVVNAVYNDTDIILCVLDNSTTAMTGTQPHPGTGETMMGSVSAKVSISRVLEAIGVTVIATVNPFDLETTEEAVSAAADASGVRAVIFEAPCIQIVRPSPLYEVDPEACTGCRKCIRELGCPALSMDAGKAIIDPALCWGCSICAQVCPFDAIKLEAGHA